VATQNAYKRQASVSPAGFESTTVATDQPQVIVLECSATGIGFGFVRGRNLSVTGYKTQDETF
jgi:hypothetical protein